MVANRLHLRGVNGEVDRASIAAAAAESAESEIQGMRLAVGRMVQRNTRRNVDPAVATGAADTLCKHAAGPVADRPLERVLHDRVAERAEAGREHIASYVRSHRVRRATATTEAADAQRRRDRIPAARGRQRPRDVHAAVAAATADGLCHDTVRTRARGCS
jgi:hypothetical protein